MAKIATRAKNPRSTRKTTRKAMTATKSSNIPGTTKQDAVIALLRRQQGASIEELVELTGWLPASTRGFMSGALKKRLGIEVISDKNAKTGERRYYVAPLKS